MSISRLIFLLKILAPEGLTQLIISTTELNTYSINCLLNKQNINVCV